MRRSTLLIAAAATLAGAAGLARAADPVSALKGHDSGAPIDVTADRIEVQDRSDRAIFAGNVHVKQATLALDTERLTVSYSSSGGIQIRRLDAAGGVVVRSPSETARGNFGIYDLDTGRAVIDGGAPGVGQSGGRVTGHFTVPKKTR